MIIASCLLFNIFSINAQSACPADLNEEECQNYKQGAVAAGRIEPLIASAGGDRTVLIGKEILFSAHDSRIPSYFDKEEIEYWWNFGDMSALERGEEVKHIYDQTGNYQVKLEIRTPEESVEDRALLKAVDRALFLIVGEDQNVFSRTNVLNQAERMGFLVHIVAIKEEGHNFVIEDQLVNTLLERIEDIRESNLIIGWTKNSIEVNGLLRLEHRLEDKSVFADKSLVIASDSLGLISRRVQPIYDTLLPKNVLLVQPELVEKVIEGESKNQLIKEVQSEGSGFILLGVHSRRNFGKVTFYNFLSHFINSLINRGVSINTIL
ncbi:MAG: PKD domain-containing protein, partial [Patescibacteria group bacterium]